MNFTNLKNFMDESTATRTPGNAIEVYLGGQPVFRYASGYADLATETPLTGEEMFNIYSCSKIATVTAGTQLLERGEILLSDPLYDYLPEFRDMNIKQPDGNLVKAKNPITIGDLFSMTAGFSYNCKTPAFEKARELTGGKMDTVTAIKCLAEEPLLFEPGDRWCYSLCHDVLAALVSAVSGQKFRDYMKKNIFEPLEMKDVVYHHTEETLKRTATQYAFVSSEEDDTDIVKAQFSSSAKGGVFKDVGKEVSLILGEEYDSGGAGIITTVSEYAKLAAALANSGIGVTGERILSPYTIDLMRTNRLNEKLMSMFSCGHSSGYGYGLGVRTHVDPARSGSVSSLGEFGWAGAAGSCVFVDPDIGLGVFYAQHTLNPREGYYLPRLRNVIYSCL